MSRPPGFFRQQSAAAWLSFLLFFGVLAFFFPWLLGLAAGVSFSLGLTWVIYRAMGGS